MLQRSLRANSRLIARVARVARVAGPTRNPTAIVIPRANLRWSSSMPLRAKMSSIQHLPTTPLQEMAPAESDPPEDVLVNKVKGLRTLELNNPAKLNSLDASMVRKLAPRLREWINSELATVVALKGAGAKAMCAGGDVMTLAKQNLQGSEGIAKSADFFAHEYCLDHLIATYPKPVVALMDGITMGGGVGLSVHAPFRVATERTVFAMPETNIGFFPDVGVGFFLARMPGELGTYLALTSDRIKAANVYWTSVATHYVHSSQLPALEQRLGELRFADHEDQATRNELVHRTIQEFHASTPAPEESFAWGGKTRQLIDSCFCFDSVSEILNALETQKENPVWGQNVAKMIRQRSPTAVTVTLHQLRESRNLSIVETFRRDHRLAARFMAHSDFSEGVIALLGKPRRDAKWEPQTLEDIPNQQQYVNSFCSDGPNPPDLKLWTSGDYMEYPTSYGTPTEFALFQKMESVKLMSTKQEVINWVLKEWNREFDIKGVVTDMVNRRTKVQDGHVVFDATSYERQRLRRLSK